MCASSGLPGHLRLAAACLMAVLALPAAAQSNTREQEQVRRLRQQVQQLQQERATQQQAAQSAATAQAAQAAQAMQTKTALDAAQAELRSLKASQAKGATEAQKEIEQLRAASAALQARLDQVQNQLDTGTRSLAQLRTEGADAARKLAFRETQLGELAERHVRQAQGLQQCIVNNQALRDLGSELMQRYADKGVAEVLAQNEPFLQTRRVALENLLQGYQDKLDQLALKAAAAPPGTSAATPPVEVPARAP
jgi:DNA repair exonuclease SbcCD ATPase subunit